MCAIPSTARAGCSSSSGMGFARSRNGTTGAALGLYSRNQKDFKKRFPPIVEALVELKRPAILDGEIVALDDHGHSRFEWLVNRGPQRGTLVYYVFDLLMLDGKDIRLLPLLKPLGTKEPKKQSGTSSKRSPKITFTAYHRPRRCWLLRLLHSCPYW